MPAYEDFLFVTADAALTERVAAACLDGSWSHVTAATSDEALAAFDRGRFRCILVDADDDALRGLQILEWMRARAAFSAFGAFVRGENAGVGTFAAGAADCLGPEECADTMLLSRRLSYVLKRFEIERALTVFETGSVDGVAPLSWVGAAPAARYALEKALAAAASRVPTLIRGAHGAGAGRLARIIAARVGGAEVWFHPDSADRDAQEAAFRETVRPLCAAGAGTICVAEVGDLNPAVQEVLAGFVRGRGLPGEGAREFPDAKVVATSSTDLELLVRAGRFRGDLYAALSHESVAVAALAERKSDVPYLVAYFLETEFSGGTARYFSDDALAALESHDWPGNVAELKALVRGLAASVRSAMIKAKDLPPAILEKGFYLPGSGEEDWHEKPYVDAKRIALNKFNREYISELLTRANNNLTVAAEKAGMDRSNFKKIIKKYFPDDD